MKTTKMLLYFTALAGLGLLSACSDDEDDAPPPSGAIELTGDLVSQTLSPGNNYLLKGQVFVRDGVVLTIQAGTIIKGDKVTRGTLVVDKGGIIEAEGTSANPIIMTSSQPAGIRDRGDWGGLVILGAANTNQNNPNVEGISPPVVFGTFQNDANDNESSGIYKYIRVEFAGVELSPNNETNSITMGGVGRGTEMEYCQVSFGGDDGYEWFGGTVNAKHLISLATWDDDFDCDYGWSGNVQYGLAVRYPSFADQSGSNAFECDNGPVDDDLTPYTTGTFSNVTILGPAKTGTGSGISGNFQHGIDLRRRTAIRIANSVVTGFPRGVRMNNLSVEQNYTNNIGYLHNNILAATNNANNYLSGGGASATFVETYWTEHNTTVEGPASDENHIAIGINPDLFFGTRLASDYPSNPDFSLTSGTASAGADFAHPMFSEPNRTGFFDDVTFRGGFGASDWTNGWAEFDPVDAAY
jgi:hypothetical protein